MGDKIKQVTERATLFRITSNAMINVSNPSVKDQGARSSALECVTDMLHFFFNLLGM